MIGIYEIRNKVNGKRYIGSSKQVEKRWNQHILSLEKGIHHSIPLQRAWDKYGRHNFEFTLIEECNQDNMVEVEQHHLNKNPEYNVGKHALGGDNISKHPDRTQIVEKIGKAVRERYKGLSKEDKKRIYGKSGDDNPNWKGGKTFCRCGTRINSSANSCIKCMDRSGENNPFFGKTHSEKTKQTLREFASKRTTKPSNTRKVECNGVVYESGSEAAKQLGISRALVNYRVKSTKYNYRWI